VSNRYFKFDAALLAAGQNIINGPENRTGIICLKKSSGCKGYIAAMLRGLPKARLLDAVCCI